MHIDTEALAALAGLEPMPRQPLAINPCPEGYQLKLVGGNLVCVLEGAEELDVRQAQQMAAAGRGRLSASYSQRIPPAATAQLVSGGAPQSGGGG